uniref:Putative site-specific DNA endonuclease n=1 Tax=Stigeoclonium helveticum TaxID=55999 RepID=Q06SE8_STIHE|nr:putative site-specific DNA endonuclease [Stigeoclonium helveticum]ABF60219.1 putative site-specific DNA endonuclease [Stigeoclonium helveticum]
MLGGYVKKRSGINAYRYRLHNKAGMMHLIQLINGHIRNSQRIPQLQRICNLYNIPFKDPIPLTDNNGCWFSGFFDAEGSVSYSMKRSLPQLVVKVFLINIKVI